MNYIRGLVSPIPGGMWTVAAVLAAALCVQALIWHNSRVDAAVLAAVSEYKLKLSGADDRVRKAEQLARAAIEAADRRAADATAAIQSRMVQLQGELENARSSVPLPTDCNACRIPASRVWSADRVRQGGGGDVSANSAPESTGSIARPRR
ncbi:MAG: hypothetical protein ACRCU1_02425 [Alsobacter sp.]